LRFPIAGIGSRFLAILTDSIIQGVTLFFWFWALRLSLRYTEDSRACGAGVGYVAKWFVAGVVLFYFLLYWGYYSLFEAFWNGQTPGKRAEDSRDQRFGTADHLV